MRRLIVLIMLLSLYLAACRSIAITPPLSPLSNALSPLPAPRGERYSMYMPYLSNGGTVASSEPCKGSIMEQQLTLLFVTDPGQQRLHPTCDPRLARSAKQHAQDMASNGYFSHLDRQGHTPNYRARKSGCTLPDFYPWEGNQIESIGLNYASAADAWQGWFNSPGHRMHVLGTIPFWAQQTSFGIAVAESDYGRVFVLITAPDCEP